MSIFFVTDHDAATKCNHAVAMKMTAVSEVRLFSDQATAETLRLELANHGNDKTAFLMSHGRPTHIVGNDNEVALEQSDLAQLAQWNIFAWACWTSCRLGYHLAQQDVIWWGYDCAITAPDPRPKYIDVYVDLFNFVKDGFFKASTSEDILEFIHRIKDEVDLAVQKLDVLTQNDPPETILSLYSCCEQLWKALRVWLDKAEQPVRHPFAPEPYLEL